MLAHRAEKFPEIMFKDWCLLSIPVYSNIMGFVGYYPNDKLPDCLYKVLGRWVWGR